MRLMEAVGSEKESPILVLTMASPQSLQKSVVRRIRSWMNCGSSKVSSSIISGLRRSMAIVHGPTATAPIAVGDGRLALVHVPELVDLHVAGRQLGFVLHELGDGVADAALVSAAQTLDDRLHPGPWGTEGHLVVLGLTEDAVAGAGEDDLGLAGLHGRHDDVRADGAALEGRGQAPAALPQGGLHEAHDLGGAGVDADHVRLEGRALERRDEEARVLAGRELVDGRLGALARLLGLGVHPLAQRPDVVDRQRLVEADGGDAERADVILAREGDGPAVAAGHVDDLATHAELLEVPRRALGPLRYLLSGPEHPDRHRKGLRADVDLQFPVRRLRVDHRVVSFLGAGTRVVARPPPGAHPGYRPPRTRFRSR